MEQSAQAETEPNKKRELKSHYEGSHSPFGFIWQIANATGWSVRYIMWGVNYQTLLMMLADAPRYVDEGASPVPSGRKGEGKEISQKKSVIDFFQSQLNATS